MLIAVDKDTLEVKYSARSDADTVLSLTNHSYFTLGCKSIRGLTLYVNADKYLKVDPDALIAESIEPVTSILDFRNPKKLTKNILDESLQSSRLNGYDHFLYFSNKGIENKNVVLSNSKIEMQVFTDFEGVQIYTSGFASECELYPEGPELHHSVAIEPSDSFNKLHFLKKDSLYSRSIKYIFLYRDGE